jgi:hypothetical protein
LKGTKFTRISACKNAWYISSITIYLSIFVTIFLPETNINWNIPQNPPWKFPLLQKESEQMKITHEGR